MSTATPTGPMSRNYDQDQFEWLLFLFPLHSLVVDSTQPYRKCSLSGMVLFALLGEMLQSHFSDAYFSSMHNLGNENVCTVSVIRLNNDGPIINVQCKLSKQ